MELEIQKVIAKAMKDKKFSDELKKAAEKGLGKKIESSEMKDLLTKFVANPKDLTSLQTQKSGTTTILTIFTVTSLACTMTTTTTTTTMAKFVENSNDEVKQQK